MQKLLDTIDVLNYSCSLIIITPRSAYRAWVAEYQRARGLESYTFDIPELYTTVVIPRIDLFYTDEEFEAFLDLLKPGILRSELARIGATAEDLGYDMNSGSFDFFSPPILEITLAWLRISWGQGQEKGTERRKRI